MKKNTKPKENPPPEADRKRLVIAGRVPSKLHQRIQEAAASSGRTMSEELAWRAEQSFEWEKAHGDRRRMLAETRAILEGQQQAGLSKAGWTKVAGIGGDAWFPPGVNYARWIVDNSNRAVIEEMLDRAAHRALVRAGLAKEDEQ